MNVVFVAALALAALAAAMLLAWRIIEKTGRSGYADAIWSLSTGAVCAAMALAAHGITHPRGALLAGLCLIWGLRLGGHILTRSHGAGDDPRYAALRAEWGTAAPWRMALFLQSQALAGWMLALSVLAAASGLSPLGAGDALGLFVAVLALLGERRADRQLAAFKAEKAGPVCDRGLWALSRHPNYLFEWLWWCGIALIGVASGDWIGLAALTAPVAMYALLVHVSGIPPLEKHMLESRREAYAAYSERVPAFFPRLFQERDR